MDEVKIDRRTKEYKDSVQQVDYGLAENNPGFKLCMICGRDNLPPNEDGSPKWRKYGEPCQDCTWRNK